MATTTPDRRAVITEALHKIDELTARLQIAEQADTEPIAVVGMGCRFPGGADDPEQFWQLLVEGRSGIVRVPPQRWDADALYSDDHSVPGTICTREGGFLTGWQPEEFDAEFFGIAPREAAAMDPQQRLLLEVAWEALENAGLTPQHIRGTQTSVFIGLTTNDYSLTFAGKLRREDIDPYVPFGNAANFAAGRLAYFLGARGPALVIDTACSSSLVAVHLACQSLRRRESDTALAAGTNLMLSPENSIACSRWGMLAPDGRCKTFDAGADGYVRSEGCGVVVLKRLTDALRDGDPVWALVRGSAVNQDGASSGQTVPNGPAQQALLRQALAAARLTPADIDYVEAHGTGTALGDPIELDALSQVFGERPDTAPLVLGSVKTNLGHLESAAGVAGFIKTVLSVNHGYIPRHLNFATLTPHAGEAAARFTIAAEPMDWPPVNRPRRAGVSSFGVSGTNAHVVVEQAPDRDPVVREPEPAVSTLVVSGKTPQRIASLAAELADWMTGAGAAVGLADVAHTLNHHRARYPRFATVCARDRDQAVTGLQALATGHSAPGVVGVQTGPTGPGTVFVYSGQGSQWAGMGQRLLVEEPAFAAAVAAVEPVFVEHVGFSLQQVLTDGEPVTGDARVQPVIMGLQLALTELWRCYGVNPDAVLGHSMGEVSAAVVAGALSVADGLRVIATRSRLMSRLAGQGAVALLQLDAEATAALIADYHGVSVAGYSAPHQTVIAGPPAQVDAVISAVQRRDQFAWRVNMEVASHTAFMDPILPELRSALADLTPRPPSIPVISTVIDAGTPAFDADYWVDNVRRPVRLHQALSAAGQNHATFIEISPHPMLTRAITDTLGETRSLGTLWRYGDDTVSFHTNLNSAQLPAMPHPAEPHPMLPTTPWQHTRHWIDLPEGADPGAGRPTTPACDEPAAADTVAGDAVLLDEDGQVAVTVRGLRLQRIRDPRSAELEDTLYQLRWRPEPRTAPGTDAASAGRWLIFTDGTTTSGALQRLLEQRSHSCVLVEPGVEYVRLEPARYRVDPAQPDHFRRLLRDACDDAQPCRGVLHLWGLRCAAPEDTSTESLDAARGLGVASVLHLVQALTASGRTDTPRLWLVTRGAQPVGTDGAGVSIAQAPLWGMGRSIHHEHPELRCARVDLSSGGDPAELGALVAELCADHPETDVALRGGERYVARLARCRTVGPAERPVEIRADATYLITGGLGGIGQVVAGWLAEQGAQHLVLMGRGSGAPSAAETLQALWAKGVEVVVAHGDVARADQLAAVLASIRASLPPLRGIVHAAGVLDDGILQRLDARRLAAVMAPKVEGAWNLHALTRDAELDFFVLFSSAASVLGSPGQAHYAAANAFLDALAWQRRAAGRPALSINWGPWAQVGMAAGTEQRRHLTGHGFAAMAPADGARTLSHLLATSATQVAVLRMDWAQGRAGADLPLLADLLAAPEPTAGPDRRLTDALRGADRPERQRLLEPYLRDQVAAKLGLAAPRLDIALPLNQLGLDSLTAMELRRKVELDLGIALPVVKLLDGPSVAGLAEWLADQHLGAPAPTPEPAAGNGHRNGAPVDGADGGRWVDLLTQVPEVSDDDVDELLREVLAAKEGHHDR
ncbi:type I polyketide synthase [Mycobacterium eburneum]|nr:type I polyketide synthase [Mycobacterium eburneum]TDH57241.1 type I polyketide synthase [Mycobacterium eburneum]